MKINLYKFHNKKIKIKIMHLILLWINLNQFKIFKNLEEEKFNKWRRKDNKEWSNLKSNNKQGNK